MQSNTKNFVYFQSENNESESTSPEISNESIKKALKTIASQILKEKTPSMKDLENILENKLQGTTKNPVQTEEQQEKEVYGNTEPMTKYLQKLGYLKDDNKWLTKKAFFEIGQKILEDAIKAINEDGYGFHETKNIGLGDIILDTTKKLEVGDDLKHLDVPKTILNLIQRKKSKNESIKFPLEIEFNDFEKFETKEDVKVAVVYCIDLSSTMKYSLSSGEGTRIEAAKKALWALYVLNKKFFPNDSIYIVGFGSLASQINPHDIPYLKTYDANDNFLHYTNYQAALRLSLKILKKDGSQNKRIVLITDGQPSACFVDDESQKNAILSDKPYSHFYRPDETTLSKIKNERDTKLDIHNEMVYLCYRYRQVDPAVESKTLHEAKKCRKEGIEIDTIMVSEEEELLSYVESLEKHLRGRAYYINPEKIDRVLISDFISNKKKILSSRNNW
ncbi:MAG: VWA domain-containing protein [Nitrosotalea sp.]